MRGRRAWQEMLPRSRTDSNPQTSSVKSIPSFPSVSYRVLEILDTAYLLVFSWHLQSRCEQSEVKPSFSKRSWYVFLKLLGHEALCLDPNLGCLMVPSKGREEKQNVMLWDLKRETTRPCQLIPRSLLPIICNCNYVCVGEHLKKKRSPHAQIFNWGHCTMYSHIPCSRL